MEQNLTENFLKLLKRDLDVDSWNKLIQVNKENTVDLDDITFDHEINIHGATFPNELVLNNCKFGGRVNFIGCIFGDKIETTESNFSKGLIIKGCDTSNCQSLIFSSSKFPNSQFALEVNGTDNLRYLDLNEIQCNNFYLNITSPVRTFFELNAELAELGMYPTFVLEGCVSSLPNFQGISFDKQLSTRNINLSFIIPSECNDKTSKEDGYTPTKAVKSPEMEFKDELAKLTALTLYAKDNDDRSMSHNLWAHERKLLRSYNKLSIREKCLDSIYDFVSLHGRSISRPTAGLFLTVTLLSGIIHLTASHKEGDISSFQSFAQSLTLALSKTIPFLGGIMQEASKITSDFQTPAWMLYVVPLFSFMAFVFIFLCGLGLRNRYRL